MLWALRVGIVLAALALVVLCCLRPQRTRSLLRAYFLEPQPALNLGLVRIVVFGSLLFEARHVRAAWFASLPAYFRQPLAGWEFLGQSLPLPEAWVAPCEWLLQGSLLCALLGIFTRPAAAVAAVLAIPIFLIPNLYFKVSHGPQVLIQQAGVLAASHCGDSLSIEAWLRRRRGGPAPLPNAAYTLPVRLCWLLMGTMYFFPGIWKLWISGDQWVSGEKIRYDIVQKWRDTPDFIPTVRVDHLPALLAILGTATLVVEIGFIFALFARSTRVLAALSVVGFHLGVGLTMGIWFNPIHPLIVLFDFPQLLEHPLVAPLLKVWRKFFGTFENEPAEVAPRLEPQGERLRLWPSATVGAFSLAGMLLTGILGVNSYPWGVYPRFEKRVHRSPSFVRELEFVVVDAKGRRKVIHPKFEPIEDTGKIRIMLRPLLDADDSKVTRRRLALVQRLVRETEGPFKRGDKLELYSYKWLLDPALSKEQRASDRQLVGRVRLD